jgi:hypothetical protein
LSLAVMLQEKPRLRLGADPLPGEPGVAAGGLGSKINDWFP